MKWERGLHSSPLLLVAKGSESFEQRNIFAEKICHMAKRERGYPVAGIPPPNTKSIGNDYETEQPY